MSNFAPRLIGDFIFGITSTGESRWFRAMDVTSFCATNSEITFRLGEDKDAEEILAGRLKTQEGAEKELFNLLILLAGTNDEEQ